MNKEVWIGKKGFRYWYYRVRDSEYYTLGLIGLTVIVCLILIFSLIVPQVSSWFSIREETLATRSRIAVLQANIAYLGNLNPNLLADNVKLTTTALPTEKDFGSILDAVSNSAVATNVSVNDYSFQIGTITATPQKGVKGPMQDISSVRLTVVLTGSLKNVQRFISAIQMSMPLSQVVNIDGTNTSYSLGIEFYQKAFPKIVVNDDTPLTDLPAAKQDVLTKLHKMQQAAPIPVTFPDAVSSSAATPLF